jgi:hypothetical protein
MKSIFDASFHYTPSGETDLEKTFERIWRELDERERAESSSGSEYSKVRLECSDELADIGAVELLGLRDCGLGPVLIEFLCPRCHRPHESLRLR